MDIPTPTFFKVLFARILILSGLLLLTSCGKAPQTPETDSTRPLRILAVGDPFALALERILPDLAKASGRKIELDIVGYNDNRRLILLNANDRVSRYDLVSVDAVWLADFASKNILLPLKKPISIDENAFLPSTLESCRINGTLHILPIQPHAELLWVRSDWFDEAGLAVPRSTDELLEAARRLHDPARNRYGIAWNAQRGQPLGQTMCHLFAAFGQPLLDENGKPAFHSERGLQAARYAKSLMAYSPPDILSMAWDQRVGRFASGTVAMTYGWGARAFLVEDEPSSRVRGLVRYTPPPHAPDAAPVTPLGIWGLGIPANVADPAAALALMDILFREEHQRALALNGNGGTPLRSLRDDPVLQQRYPVLKTMASAEVQNNLSAAMRPSIPQWDALCEILGSEFHDMLMDRLQPEEALLRAHQAALQLLDGSEPQP